MARRRKRASMGASGLEFNHALIYVRGLERALHFYVDLLGFKLIEEKQGYARLRSPRGHTTLALHEPEPDQQLPEHTGIRLYFEVEELEEFCEKLKEAGVKSLQGPQEMPWGWKHAYLKDPDGHELSLYWAGEKRFEKTPDKKG